MPHFEEVEIDLTPSEHQVNQLIWAETGIEGKGVARTWNTPESDQVILIADESGVRISDDDGTTPPTPVIVEGTAAGGKLEGEYPNPGIAEGAVTSREILDGTIVTVDLADNAVTLAKMADNSVGTAELIDSSVTLAKMADASVGTVELVDSSVTLAKMADNSVGTTELVDNAVTLAKMADASVGTVELVANAATQLWYVRFGGDSRASTSMGPISGASITLVSTGVPLLVGVTLVGYGGSAAYSGSAVQIFEGGSVVTGGALMNEYGAASQYVVKAATTVLTPSAGSHTYVLNWNSAAGTISINGGTFWAVELKR